MRRPLPRVSGLGAEILTGLYRHRLVSTSQAHVIHAPQLTRRRIRMVLCDLERTGYVSRVGIAGSMETAWYVTAAGAEAVEGAGVDVRPYRLNASRAGGPLQAHTMAVNDVGIAFLAAARSRGEDFDVAGWRHEAAHPLGEGRKPELVIADAVLDYVVHDPDGEVLVCRFLELDRATMSVREVATKLANYARLHAYQPAARPGSEAPRGWRQHYHRRFPKVMVVMSGRPVPTLARRRDSLLELVRRDARVMALRDELGISVTTLEDLRRQGPFAGVFRRLGDPDTPVDVLGRPAPGCVERAAG